MCVCKCSANLTHNCSATVERELCYIARLRCAPPANTTVVLIAVFTMPPSPAGKLYNVCINSWIRPCQSNQLTLFLLASHLDSTCLEAHRTGGTVGWNDHGLLSSSVHFLDFFLSAGHPRNFLGHSSFVTSIDFICTAHTSSTESSKQGATEQLEPNFLIQFPYPSLLSCVSVTDFHFWGRKARIGSDLPSRVSGFGTESGQGSDRSCHHCHRVAQPLRQRSLPIPRHSKCTFDA